MRQRWNRTAGLAGLAGLVGCGGDADPAARPAVRDSAGVRIVEYAGAPMHNAPFSFSSQPVYRHGAGSGDYLFGRIWSGVLFADGRAAIYDADNTEIVVIGSGGATHELLARSGEGPGEIGMVQSMFTVGADSLLVEDDWNARFTLFAGGSMAESVSLQEHVALSQGFWALGSDASGRLLMSSASYRRGFPEDWLAGHMIRLDLDARAADTVASYDWIPYRSPDDEAENAFPPGGQVAAADGRFVYARSDVPEIVWREPDGAVSQIVRWQPDVTYPGEEHWQTFEAYLRLTIPAINPQVRTDEAREALIQRVLAGYRVEEDEPLPLFGTFFGDDEGRLWVPGFAVAALRHGYPAYSVISPAGEWLGRVDVPPGFRILDVSGGRILGVLRDDMDVESVVVYGLVGG